MNDLADFLLARIAEDEILARARVEAPEWHGVDAWGEETVDYLLSPNGPCDPVRVLAKCRADRLIVERYQRAQAALEEDQRRVRAGGYSDERGTVAEWDESALRPVLSLLALPYADHSDYREEWKP